MTNTTELRKRFEERFRDTFSDLTEGSDEDFAYTRLTEDVLSFLQSEIEQAERAKVEEVIEEVDGTHKVLANELRLRFLTKPNNE